MMRGIRGLRWWMISLLMLGAIINYLTRSTLSVAAPTVLVDLQITEKQYSWILGAFQGAIMLQPICGYVMDVIGLKLGFAIFAVAWSLISMAHGLAGSWTALLLAARTPRTRRGLGESRGDEGHIRVVSGAGTWPCRRRVQHRRVVRLDARAAARGLGDPRPTTGSRRLSLTGALGLVWVALWLWLYQSARETSALSDEERQHILAGSGAIPSR